MVTRNVASTFDLLPAIDLRGGRVVRLEQGDFDRETAFSDDPVAIARSFVDAGARWLHVVDLDGARSGAPRHRGVAAAIAGATRGLARIEVAGGLRSDGAIDDAIALGARRVVLGTAALRHPDWVGRVIERLGPACVVVALDIRDGQAVGEGWRIGASGIPVEDAIARLLDVGVATFEVTAIERDGLSGGPDVDRYRDLRRRAPGASIIASAGIASVDHLRSTRDGGCAGAIVGRALYDGRLAVSDALAAVDVATSDPTTGQVRRPSDGEVLGIVRRDGHGWVAETAFGGRIGVDETRADALDRIERDGLAALARRWWFRPGLDAAWEAVLVGEAWPGRVRLIRGPAALPGTETVEVTVEQLAAGASIRLDDPSALDVP